jgi:hypothetical protein
MSDFGGPVKAIPVAPGKRTTIDQSFVTTPDEGSGGVPAEPVEPPEPVPEEWSKPKRRRRHRIRRTTKVIERKPRQAPLPAREVAELNIKREFAKRKQPLELKDQINVILQAARELTRPELDTFAGVTAMLQGLTPAGRKHVIGALVQVYST